MPVAQAPFNELPGSTQVYPGHGSNTTIEFEKKYQGRTCKRAPISISDRQQLSESVLWFQSLEMLASRQTFERVATIFIIAARSLI